MQKRLGLDLEVSDEFGIGLAWYVTGEGTFMANIEKVKAINSRRLALVFAIGIRADDRTGLEYIREMLGGIGKIYDTPAIRTSKPGVIYKIRRIADLYHVVVPLFERYPLPKQWRKARDFNIWKQLVDIKYHEGKRPSLGRNIGWLPIPQSYWDKVLPLVEELKQVRAYSPPS